MMVGSNISYNHGERPLLCSGRSTDDVMRINFRFRFWSRGYLLMVVLHSVPDCVQTSSSSAETLAFHEM